MNLQFILDSTGQTTGVFIPIEEWNKLKNKFKGIEEEETNIPNWHKEIVRECIDNHKKNPEQAIDFDIAMDDIGRSL